MAWSIWYTNDRVDGVTAEDWRAAPSHGVQVVVLWEVPPIHNRRWVGVTDRVIYTGEDVYDPFDYGPKYGELIPFEDYERIWHAAFHGSR